tara:strand:- start:286 stop:1065 length:780 start_codon:yes stop_codon:yes gene_type:complete
MYYILFLISIFIFIYCKYKLKDEAEKFTLNNELYLSMTTIPERLIHPWFLNNIKYLLSLGSYFKIIINIPYYFKRNNEIYIIPNELVKLADKTNRIILNRVKEDYGPITKLYGPLLNNSIPDEADILILDDDIHYKPEFINIIFNKYKNDTNKIYSFCDNTIQGYHSFLVKKKILKPILKFKNPNNCFRIDDNFIQLSVKKLNIPIEMVSYKGKTGNFCSINKDIHDNHTPKWDELKWDDRTPIVEKCYKDFIKLNCYY